MLTPVLVLVVWTLVVWLWMYAKRIPAMQAAKIKPQDAIHAGSLSSLPTDARVVADNYNHLMEQPVIFYALVFYTYLTGAADGLYVALAWGYVGLRVVHSIIQIIVKNVTMRFAVFSLSTFLLMIMAVRNLLALA